MRLISILGMDPSMRNWGLAAGTYDLDSGKIDVIDLSIIHSDPGELKQVRQNSKDLISAEILCKELYSICSKYKFIFAEVPVGSQSSRAQTSYGMCIGILGFLRALGNVIIEVNPTQVKLAVGRSKTASKHQMVEEAYSLHPRANWPIRNGIVVGKAEHMADAIGSIYAGIQTEEFKSVISMYNLIKG